VKAAQQTAGDEASQREAGPAAGLQEAGPAQAEAGPAQAASRRRRNQLGVGLLTVLAGAAYSAFALIRYHTYLSASYDLVIPTPTCSPGSRS
jgi:hypothetical protein